MSRIIPIVLILAVAGLACASRSGSFSDSDAVTEISWTQSSGADPAGNADAVLDRYSVDFKVPNPLIDAGISTRRSDPSHENLIYCRATLLDSISTEADIAFACRKDSLDVQAGAEFRRKYLEERTSPGRFRIRISMESGFSPKSLDPAHWVMYIVNSRGVMIEPVQIQSSLANTVQDSIYSNFHRLSLPRTRIHGEIILSFDRVTFFKQDLLGSDNQFIALEMAREQKTVARVVWKNASAAKGR